MIIAAFVLGFFTAYATILLGILAMLADLGKDPPR